MSIFRPRSLQAQLALRLSALFLVATTLAVAALLIQTYLETESMSEQSLLERADDLARAIATGTQGAPILVLPARLAAAYAVPGEGQMFAVRDFKGDVVAASGDAIRAVAATWSAADDEPRFFRLESFGPAAADYYGLDVLLATAAGPLSITVAEAGDADELLHAMLGEFLIDVAWIIPVFVAATLVVGVAAIRRGLAPLREVSALAATIEPSAMSVRLPTENLPAEVVPLVRAVNRALERLEEGFAVQRRFTANAAHELRTPLAIVTGALDALEGNGNVAKVRQDVARMNRLVEQLLRVARLDGLTLDISEDVDLGRVAADVVEYMAPLAIARERSLALSAAAGAVHIKGNRNAIEDAVRNLVENAIAHTAPHTEVGVTVGADGTVGVADRGPGISTAEREHLFDRFWKGRASRNAGAGLGLAIVEEIMRAHGGEVSIHDRAGGGAEFKLTFASTPRG